MESNVTKILIKKFWKRCVTLPSIAHMRYGPSLLVLTFTDDPPLWGPSPPPPPIKNVPSLSSSWFPVTCYGQFALPVCKILNVCKRTTGDRLLRYSRGECPALDSLVSEREKTLLYLEKYIILKPWYREVRPLGIHNKCFSLQARVPFGS